MRDSMGKYLFGIYLTQPNIDFMFVVFRCVGCLWITCVILKIYCHSLYTSNVVGILTFMSMIKF